MYFIGYLKGLTEMNIKWLPDCSLGSVMNQGVACVWGQEGVTVTFFIGEHDKPNL